MRITFVLVLFLAAVRMIAQNVVPNPGFELVTNCPNSIGYIYDAVPWQSSNGSPDLFNSCGSPQLDVPNNWAGFQFANAGVGYVGIATYSQDWHGLNAREFLKCMLEYPLATGQDYYIQFHVSQADSLQFATHNLGVTFTTVDTGQFGELLCWPDCPIYYENTSANPLSSKTDWVKVSGTFTAIGGERYIHIGNFRTDDESEIEFVGGGIDPNTVWNQAYYYIDDVWLSHIDSMHYVGVEAPLPPKGGVRVWPNPATDVLHVELSERNISSVQIEVKDLLGRSVLTASANSSKFQIDIGALNSGVYFVVMRDRAGGVLVQKVVKE